MGKTMIKIFTPEFLKEIGFFLIEEKVSEYRPYQTYGSAKDCIGMTHINCNEDGPDSTYFGIPITEPSNYVSITKDATIRTVFNGYVFSQDDVRLLLKLTA